MRSATCPVCKRTVRVVVPRGGDGSLDMIIRHYATPGVRCEGSRRVVFRGASREGAVKRIVRKYPKRATLWDVVPRVWFRPGSPFPSGETLEIGTSWDSTLCGKPFETQSWSSLKETLLRDVPTRHRERCADQLRAVADWLERQQCAVRCCAKCGERVLSGGGARESHGGRLLCGLCVDDELNERITS